MCANIDFAAGNATIFDLYAMTHIYISKSENLPLVVTEALWKTYFPVSGYASALYGISFCFCFKWQMTKAFSSHLNMSNCWRSSANIHVPLHVAAHLQQAFHIKHHWKAHSLHVWRWRAWLLRTNSVSAKETKQLCRAQWTFLSLELYGAPLISVGVKPYTLNFLVYPFSSDDGDLQGQIRKLGWNLTRIEPGSESSGTWWGPKGKGQILLFAYKRLQGVGRVL